MYKFTQTLVLLFTCFITLEAQFTDITLSADSLFLEITGPDSDGDGDSTCGLELIAENESTDNISLRWYKEVLINTQPQWKFHICDANQCYLHTVDSADVLLTAPGFSQLDGWTSFVLGFDDFGVDNYTGYAEVALTLLDLNDTKNSTTIIFIFQGGNVTSTTHERSYKSFRVYPNPSTDLIHVADFNNFGAKHLKIIDMIGSVKQEIDLIGDRSLDVSNLNAGMYNIVLYGNDGEIIGSERFSKI